MTTVDKSPERVSDEELASAEQLAEDVGAAWPGTIQAIRSLLPRLAAEVRALREPVPDIEAEVEQAALAAIKVASNRYDLEVWKQLIRPHVERAAVLAREAEGLRGQLAIEYAARGDDIRHLNAQIDTLRAEFNAARAEFERLKQEIRSLQTYDRGDLL